MSKSRDIYRKRGTVVPGTCKCGYADPNMELKHNALTYCGRCKSEQTLLARYGVDYEWLARKLVAQNFRCGCCYSWLNYRAPDFRKVWHLDHSHETGKARDIVCPGCNLAIGRAEAERYTMRGLPGAVGAYILRHSKGG